MIGIEMDCKTPWTGKRRKKNEREENGIKRDIALSKYHDWRAKKAITIYKCHSSLLFNQFNSKER
jgi:hypothetical protein